jgi:hypothetical protein
MMKQADFSGVQFHKSSFSAADCDCVEIGMQEGTVYVRDTKDQSGAILVFNSKEWDAFLKGVKAGEFELPTDL